MRPRIYVAGPIGHGDLLHNINQATEAFVALAQAGLAPFCPHWSVYAKPARKFLRSIFDKTDGDVWCQATVQGNEAMSHDDWMSVDLSWVAASDGLLRLPGESKGADAEVAEAIVKGIPVFHSVAEAVEHFAASTQVVS